MAPGINEGSSTPYRVSYIDSISSHKHKLVELPTFNYGFRDCVIISHLDVLREVVTKFLVMKLIKAVDFIERLTTYIFCEP